MDSNWQFEIALFDVGHHFKRWFGHNFSEIFGETFNEISSETFSKILSEIFIKNLNHLEGLEAIRRLIERSPIGQLLE